MSETEVEREGVSGWMIGLAVVVVGVFIAIIYFYLNKGIQKAFGETQQALQLQHLGSGKMTADGSEQILFEFVCTTPFKIDGWVNLKNMAGGDTLRVSEFIKLGIDKAYDLYEFYDYEGAQDKPIVYIRPRPSIYGAKITIQQSAGVFKAFEWEFYKGVTS